ncbi:MAG: GH3 auxin-responsive promoter family protein, partial [Flavihumibacter sp.]|nr:GH3 auxin-responsive promoter family protein [Flavihumibacter sp.]
MKFKSFLARPFAAYIYKQVKKEMQTALEDQEKIFQALLKTGAKTVFGADHRLAGVKTYDEFKNAVP